MSKEDEDKYKRLIEENKQLAAKIKEVHILVPKVQYSSSSPLPPLISN